MSNLREFRRLCKVEVLSHSLVEGQDLVALLERFLNRFEKIEYN